jgi:hypothetical protein
MEDFQFRIERPPPETLLLSSHLWVFLYSLVSQLEPVQAARTHDYERSVWRGKREVSSCQMKGEILIQAVSGRGTAAVPVIEFDQPEAESLRDFHQGQIAFFCRGRH